MVVEILINVIDKSANKNGWGPGYPVVAKEQGWNWGAAECFPNFAMARITDAPTLEDVKNYITPWIRKTAYTIISHDPTQDYFEVKTFADPDTVSASGVGKLLAQDMHDMLTSWGAKEVGDVDGGVRFTITAMDALNATGYLNFGPEEEYVIFNETAYDAVSGAHTIECDYSTSMVKQEQMVQALKTAQCEIVSHDTVNAKVVFIAMRVTMISFLEQEVRRQFDNMIGRSQYYFPTSVLGASCSEMTFSDMKEMLLDIRNS